MRGTHAFIVPENCFKGSSCVRITKKITKVRFWSRAWTIQILYFRMYWSLEILCSVSFLWKFSIPLRLGSCTGQSYQEEGRERFSSVRRSLTLRDFPQRVQTSTDWVLASECEGIFRLLKKFSFFSITYTSNGIIGVTRASAMGFEIEYLIFYFGKRFHISFKICTLIWCLQ